MYDFAWYVGRGTELDLVHLEQRMRQSGHYEDTAPLTEKKFRQILADKISGLDVVNAREDVVRFLPDQSSVEIWPREFLQQLLRKSR